MKYRPPEAKRKPKNTIKLFFIFFLFLFLAFSLCLYGGFKQISDSNFFTIKKVKIKGDIGWLEKSVRFLIGDNLFFADLGKAKKILINQNPEIDAIILTKLWPDMVYVRFALKQPIAILEPGQIVVDKNGFMLERGKFKNERIDLLPIIAGIPTKQFAPKGRLISEQWHSAFEIINLFSKEQALGDYKLTAVDVKQISENSLFIKKKTALPEEPAIMIKIGEGNVAGKLEMLKTFIKKANVDWSKVNYIDLRFKEPIIGLKNV